MNNNKYIEVKDSDIHLNGVFAKQDIPKDTKIIEYIGRKISKEESEKVLHHTHSNHTKDPENHAGTYIFELDDEWDLDGDIPENDAKYINHSCESNCRCEIKDGQVWIYALRDIQKGEEITYNYCFEINEDDPYDFMEHPCKCGSKKCVGYMLDEEEWPRMRALLSKRDKQ
jgi:uncharacterized protein